MSDTRTTSAYGEEPEWSPGKPRIRVLHLLISWIGTSVALFVAAAIVPDASVKSFWGAFVAVAAIAILNALLSPLVAALRLPWMLPIAFVLILVLDALMLL